MVITLIKNNGKKWPDVYTLLESFSKAKNNGTTELLVAVQQVVLKAVDTIGNYSK